MYRSAWVHPNDRVYLSIIHDGKRFELNTITYSTGPATAQATKLLDVIGKKCAKTKPKASKAIRSRFYMDDYISGDDSVEEAVQLRRDVHNELSSYSFNLRKYRSNTPEVIANLEDHLIEKNANMYLGKDEALSILGLLWSTTSDVFCLKAQIDVPDSTVTKRQMLSSISKVFDPLGLASPVTIRGKIMLQELWKLGISWDDPVPANVDKKFRTYVSDVRNLTNFEVPRYISDYNVNFEYIVGFSDASESAYCAVVYALNDNVVPVRTQLYSSKTRVAPIKILKIPELELQAATLLVDLANRVRHTLGIDPNRVRLYTDSTVVLAWLSRPPSDWKTFVRNRVAKIVSSYPITHWNHVRSGDNPADLGTRGISTNDIIQSGLWRNGPKFIRDQSSSSDVIKIDSPSSNQYLAKQKASVCLTVEFENEFKLIESYSSYEKLVRIFATAKVIARKLCSRSSGALPKVEARDMAFAHEYLVRVVQAIAFAEDLHRLKSNRKLCKRSILRRLNPFIDECGVLRSRSRLQNARIPFNEKCPIILPAKNHFTIIWVRHLHERHFENLHANRPVLLAYLSADYVFVGGISRLIKTVIHKCVICCRYFAKAQHQQMADLPADRVTAQSPFMIVGIDFTGAFHIKCTNHRTYKDMKAYAAIFVCFVTRAVHIELVPTLTTEDFLNALKSFISRRGYPSKVYSDNGTNFRGAERYLNLQDAEISKYAASHRIEWQFNLPYTPHRGGLWEAAVKSAKRFLPIVTKGQKFSENELRTLLVQIECILNSRPIAYTKTSESEEEVLTPGHFLIGRNMSVLSEPVRSSTVKLSAQYTANRQRVRSFWKIWFQDVLNQYRSRNKWLDPKPNIEEGQIVLIPDSNIEPCKWPLAKVTKTYPDQQNLIRTIEVLQNGSKKTIPCIQAIQLPLA